MRIVLAEREAEVMEVLWKSGPATVAEVREHLTDDLAYTTVLTILRNLKSKGYVDHREEGKAHRFRARVARTDARGNALRDLARKFFDGSAMAVMTHLVSDEALSAKELAELRQLIDRKKAERDR